MSNTNRIAEIIALANGINARMEGEGDTSSTGDDQTGSTGSDDYPSGLGDEGKRAIDRMKAERNEAKTAAAQAKAEFEAYKAANPVKQPERNAGQDGNNSQSETKTPDQIRDEVSQQVTADYNKRILRSDVRTLAKGRLTDENDALRYLDIDDLTPDANGDFDAATITSRIDKLLEGRPYLAAASKPNFQGGADSGNRGESGATKSQLTRDDMKRMSPQEISKAQEEGRFADLLSGKS